MDICPYCNLKLCEQCNKDEHIIKCQNINNIKNKHLKQRQVFIRCIKWY